MKIFFDTTVLVATSEQSHPHYAQASPALRRVATGQDKGFLGLHSIAEVYAALTRLPVQPRIHPVEATRIGKGGWIGAKIYDALLLRCATRCALERIYKLNLGDFKQLAPAGLQDKICAP